MNSINNEELTSLLEQEVLQAEIIDLFIEVHNKNDSRNNVIKAIIENPDLLENEQLYLYVREYLAIKIFDHYLLSDDEKLLVQYFPEIDEENILDVEFTDALIDKAVEQFDDLTEAEMHTLNIVLNDMFLDDDFEKFSPYQKKAFELINGISEVSNDVGSEQMTSNDYLVLEYGYKIYDLDSVKERLYFLHKNNLPMARREAKQIEKLHSFDPNAIAYAY